jgi:putative intracellular protease/amidase
MKTIKILMLLTSHAQLGNTGKPTGFWLEELATPWAVFTDAGAELTFASPQGGRAPVDPRSEKDDAASVKRFRADAGAQNKLAHTRKLSEVDVTAYDAVFVVGGHGTMWDLATPEVGSKLSDGWKAGKVLAAVCHGPAALVHVKDERGNPVVAGRKVSSFSDEEETAAELEKDMPFLLETRLRSLGGKYEKAPRFTAFSVVDGKLVTGQNPASAKVTAENVLRVLRESK